MLVVLLHITEARLSFNVVGGVESCVHCNSNNNLQWLPQKPVYNYHHCEFRFWRNVGLKTIPYSLWYHMFRGQQTRSLNIGCLNFPKHQHTSRNSKCRLQLMQGSRQWGIDIHFPRQHSTIIERNRPSPPSLFELSKRCFYEVIHKTAKRLLTTQSIYSDGWHNGNKNDCENNNVNLQDDFKGFGVKCYDMNANGLPPGRRYHNTADLINEHYFYLPKFIKDDLCNGPVSRCENINCKKPIFDHVLYEFCLEKIILIENTEEVILSAAFCSKTCADLWKSGKSSFLAWTLIK